MRREREQEPREAAGPGRGRAAAAKRGRPPFRRQAIDRDEQTSSPALSSCLAAASPGILCLEPSMSWLASPSRKREREDERALEGLSAFERFFFVEGAKCCLNEMKSFAYIFKDEPHLPSIQPSLGSLSQARASTPRSTPLPLLFLVRAFLPFTETVAIYN